MNERNTWFLRRDRARARRAARARSLSGAGSASGSRQPDRRRAPSASTSSSSEPHPELGEHRARPRRRPGRCGGCGKSVGGRSSAHAARRRGRSASSGVTSPRSRRAPRRPRRPSGRRRLAGDSSLSTIIQAAPYGSWLTVSGLSASGAFDLDHLARDRRVELGDRLHRLDGAEALARLELAPDLGQLHEDHVAELLLRVVGDADRAAVALDARSTRGLSCSGSPRGT